MNPAQLAPGPAPAERRVQAHTRKVSPKPADSDEDSLPFFDEARVPVELIVVPSPETAGLSADAFEIIGHKDSFRLAQRPGSYVVLKYRRPVIKLKATQVITCPAAPVGVIESSRADVSFVAGLLIDKFAYHLPLYRQHQRLSDAGITVSRPWLTQLSQQGGALLEPIYEAQLDSIRASRVKAMDETPIKAGRGEPGKLKAAYFWPVYGELDEVCFPFFESRRAEHVEQVLGLRHGERAVLLSDGYSAYAQYAAKTGLTHARCWAHYLERGFMLRGRCSAALFTSLWSGEPTPHNIRRCVECDRCVGSYRCRSRCTRNRVPRHTSLAASGILRVCPPVPCIRRVAARLHATGAMHA
jgi:transposase